MLILIFRLFDLRAGDCVHILCDHERFDPIVNFKFSKSGRLIFAAAKTKSLKIWDTINPDGSVFHSVPLDIDSHLQSIALTDEGGDLAVISGKGKLLVLSKNIDNLVFSEADESRESQTDSSH